MENVQPLPQPIKVQAAATPTLLREEGQTFLVEQAAKWVSVLLSPPLLGALGLVLLGIKFNTPMNWVWVAVYALGSLLGPVVLILWMMRRGELSDFHMQQRHERIKPMIGFLLLFLLSWLVFQAGSAPPVFSVLATVGVLQSAVMLIVTLAWKISGHSAGAASFSIYLLGLYGATAAPATILIPLVIWARIQRNRHDLAQSLAGAALGALSMAGAVLALNQLCPGAAFLCT